MSLKTRFAPLSIALLFAAALVGCHDNDAPITGRADTYNHPWLTLGSEELRRDIRVDDAKQTRDESGILFVNIPVRNVTDKELYVDYLVTFTDSTGREVNHVPGTLSIPARQMREAVGNSTSGKAEHFQVQLSYPRVN